MFLRQLSYLIELDKHRHFGQAAEGCHVMQPVLSTAISELGISIVKRNRSFKGITPEAECGRQILQAYPTGQVVWRVVRQGFPVGLSEDNIST
jgi:hypothetical protein